MYVINFINRTVEKLGVKENSKIKRDRWDTYFNYLAYKKTISQVNNKNVINVCESRLSEMERSDVFDGDFVRYLNTKNFKDLPFK